ncbi:MAG: UDP-N-acetylmuramate--L-alanine ligase [Candidatus Omnitrophota bacterium]
MAKSSGAAKIKIGIYMINLNTKNHIHFIGIGGIGMSAIAFVLLRMGHRVSGSDAKSSDITRKIEAAGGKFYLGHNENNIDGADIVVFSSSITPENAELKVARNRKVPALHRADILSFIMRSKKSIAVTGAHGKTTTSSLISHILFRVGLDPTIIVGGEVKSIGGNSRVGEGEHIVVEADESDGSFINLNPLFGVITNIDEEHLDYYRNIGEIISWNLRFAEGINADGKLFFCGDCENLRRALRGYSGKTVSFGLSDKLDMHPADIKLLNSHSEFNVIYRGDDLGRAALNIPGIHNISNAMAAFAVVLETGLKFDAIKRAAEDFSGAARRFQEVYSGGEIKIIDDYAHHPEEIRATIAAAKNWNPKRLVVVFQPHRFSRTKYLRQRFGRCFEPADHLVITDVYAASEEPIEGVSGKSLYEEVKGQGHKSAVFVQRKQLKEYLLRYVRPSDMILILGAGDVAYVSEELARELSECKSTKKI